MTHKIILVLLLLTLSGCATVDKAFQWAASVNDTALESAEDLQCNRASIRAVKQRYNTPEKRKAYNLLCGTILHERL